MADDKVVRLVRLLVERTKAGEIRWEETPTMNTFQCSVSNYSVLISQRSFVDISGMVQTLTVCNEEGKIIEEVDGEELRSEGVQLRELFELARRNAMGVEKALDEMLHLLEAGESKR
jgi:hypothetical protein